MSTPLPTIRHPRRSRRLVPLIALCTVIAALAAAPWPSPASPRADRTMAAKEYGLFGAATPEAEVGVRRGQSREVGMRFMPRVAGKAVGLRYYKPQRWKAATPSAATLWSSDGQVLARRKIEPVQGTGWQRVTFKAPVTLSPKSRYVVSVHTRGKGIHAATPGVFGKGRHNAQLRAPGDNNGVTVVSSSPRFPTDPARRDASFWVDVRFVPGGSGTPTATPTPTPPSSWPGPDNTGVPAGTTLTPYTGPCEISSPRTLSGVDATGSCDAIVVNTKGVVIQNSAVPGVWSIYQDGGSSVTISDSDVRAGNTSTGAIWGYNITATRVDVTGGQHSFQCNDNCVVTDSWLHDQYNPDGESYHNNAFISNGGENMVIRHNTLQCTSTLNRNDGGCTGDLSLFGDFGPIDNVTIDNNYLRANNSSISYCLYAGGNPAKPHQATNVKVTNNVFERGANRKCGVYGPVTDFDRRATGNVWTGNVWEGGGSVG
jgi:hypothetical protein